MIDTLRFRSFAVALAAQPSRLFWVFAITHLVLWTAIPSLTSPNAQLDVIEGSAWGREWLIGTYKHPPMQAWLLETIFSVFGRARVGPFLLSQIATVTAFWAVWQTGRSIFNEKQALIGVLLMEGVLYYTFLSTEFNPNVLQLPFWALACWSFHRAVRENRMMDWLLLGLWAAGGLYSKYSTALLLLCLGGLLVAHPFARQRLKSPGPYIALAVCVLLFLPHLQWLIEHDFLPFHYLTDRVAAQNRKHVIPGFILNPYALVHGQFLALMPFTLLFLLLLGRKQAEKVHPIDSFDHMFLHTVTFGSFGFTFLMAVFFNFRMHDMWGAPFWNFIGLWALMQFRPMLTGESMVRFKAAWGLIFIGTLFAYISGDVLYPYLEGKTKRVHFPGSEVSRLVTQAWHQRYGNDLTYVMGDNWPAGNVAYYAPERPHVFIHADPSISLWIDPEDVKKKGGVIIWCVSHCKGNKENMENEPPAYLSERFPQAEMQPPLVLQRHTGADLPPVKIGWAIVPPSPVAKASE